MYVFCFLYKYASHSKEKWERCDHKCVLDLLYSVKLLLLVFI